MNRASPTAGLPGRICPAYHERCISAVCQGGSCFLKSIGARQGCNPASVTIHSPPHVLQDAPQQQSKPNRSFVNTIVHAPNTRSMDLPDVENVVSIFGKS